MARTRGISHSKSISFSSWYTSLLSSADLLSYSPISGFYIYHPPSFHIWSSIKSSLTSTFLKYNIQECYYPLLITPSALSTESSHLEGFSPEVAWVTTTGCTSTSTSTEQALKESLAIRPTSETVIYPAIKHSIRTYTDLPIKLNQFSNVVRWEFKEPTPFIRSREILWQESHSFFSNSKEAYTFTLNMIEEYVKVYKNVLAVYVIKGVKTKIETFPGAEKTFTVEAIIKEVGKSVQGGTSHYLGTKFSKMFKINFKDKNNEKKEVEQNCFGISMRSVGVAIMQHGDDKGLMLSPRCSEKQIVIVVVKSKNKKKNNRVEEGESSENLNLKKEVIEETENSNLNSLYENKNSENINEENNKKEEKAEEEVFAEEVFEMLKKIGYKVILDNSNKSLGNRINNWEMKGACFRVEIGRNEAKEKKIKVVSRLMKKSSFSFSSSNFSNLNLNLNSSSSNSNLKNNEENKNEEENNLKKFFDKEFDEMHNSLYERSKKDTLESILDVKDWKEFMECIRNRKIARVSFCDEEECEKNVGIESGKENKSKKKNDNDIGGAAKSLCIVEEEFLGEKCFRCGKDSKNKVLFGRSY